MKDADYYLNNQSDQEDEEITDIKDRLMLLESSLNELCRTIRLDIVYLIGCALSIVVSYHHNHSILWGMLHGVLSWGYVVYFAIFKQ